MDKKLVFSVINNLDDLISIEEKSHQFYSPIDMWELIRENRKKINEIIDYLNQECKKS